MKIMLSGVLSSILLFGMLTITRPAKSADLLCLVSCLNVQRDCNNDCRSRPWDLNCLDECEKLTYGCIHYT